MFLALQTPCLNTRRIALCMPNDLILLNSLSLTLYTRYFHIPTRFRHANLLPPTALARKGPIPMRTPIRLLLIVSH